MGGRECCFFSKERHTLLIVKTYYIMNGDVCEVIDKHIPDFILRLSQICLGFQGFLQTQIV